MGTAEIWPFWETLELSVSPYAGTKTSGGTARPHWGPRRADDGQTDGQADGRATEICSSAGAWVMPAPKPLPALAAPREFS